MEKVDAATLYSSFISNNFPTLLAEMYLRIGQKEEAEKTLMQAKQIAICFDADPNNSLKRLRFVMPDENASAYDILRFTLT